MCHLSRRIIPGPLPLGPELLLRCDQLNCLRKHNLCSPIVQDEPRPLGAVGSSDWLGFFFNSRLKLQTSATPVSTPTAASPRISSEKTRLRIATSKQTEENQKPILKIAGRCFRAPEKPSEAFISETTLKKTGTKNPKPTLTAASITRNATFIFLPND